MTSDLDTEAALRRLATLDRTAEPSGAQWDRIRARRLAGERVSFPEAAASRGPRQAPRWLWVGLAAMLAVTLIPVVLSRGRREPPQAVLAPGMLAAQPSATPAFPVIDRLDGPRLRPGRWSFAAEPLTPGNLDTLFVYQLEPVTWRGTEAWLVVTGMQLGQQPVSYTDSTWLSRERLDPLAQWTDTVATWKPVIGNAMTLLQSVTLDSAWRASIPLASTRRDPQHPGIWWVNLAVYGRETVETPAGRFLCWKVGFRPSLGFFFWVTPEGVVVRQGMARPDDLAFGRMNLALVRVDR